jgi:hypothetical protein
MQERRIGPDGDLTACEHRTEPDLLPAAADPQSGKQAEEDRTSVIR